MYRDRNPGRSALSFLLSIDHASLGYGRGINTANLQYISGE